MGPHGPSDRTGVATDHQLQVLIAEAVPVDIGLTPMKGFKMDLSANPGFRKVFFSAHCDCGTNALLSVEVAQDKTLDEVKRVLPSLISKLQGQAKSFRSMPCDMHARLRLGPVAGR